nr:Ldh family oxidoreductase [Agrobacterium vitis]
MAPTSYVSRTTRHRSPPERQSVRDRHEPFLQVIDPAALGGAASYLDETTWLTDACHANPPKPGGEAVRVPGDRARTRIKEAQERGVTLDRSIVSGISRYVLEIGEEFPHPL